MTSLWAKLLSIIALLGSLLNTHPLGVVQTIQDLSNNPIQLTFTDDNTGEDLIISSDKHDYYGFGAVDVYFSVKNTSKTDQDINLILSFGEKTDLGSIRLFTGTKDVIIPGFTSITATGTDIMPDRTVTETVWEKMSVTDGISREIFSPAKSVKDATKNRTTLSFPLAKGETKVFVANVKTRAKVGENGEFFIEAFGDKAGYGNLDPSAWIPTDNFSATDYTAGNNLNGGAGGSGWNGNWFVDAGTMTTETASAGGQGSLAAAETGSSGAQYRRNLTGVSSGQLSYCLYMSGTTQANSIILEPAGMYVRFLSGNIAVYNTGVAYENFGTYSAGEWVVIDFEFDDAAQNDKYRAKKKGGSFSNWVASSAYTTITQYKYDVSANAETVQLDDIGETASVTCAPAAPAVVAGYEDNVIISD